MSARRPALGSAEGRPLPDHIARALRDVLGLDFSLDGLARLFQPSFPGVRAFVVEPRVAPDRAVEITLAGLARDGRPVWASRRAFVLGRDGSLEIHRGYDEVEPGFGHRNIEVDLIHRELELLAQAGTGPSRRITVDAEGDGRYLYALHGFVFADETDDGPPVRSSRPFGPEDDRSRLIAAAETFLEDAGRRLGLGRLAIEAALEEARCARAAWDLARLRFKGGTEASSPADGHEGELGATSLGRDFLLHRDTPPWRAALYLTPRDRRVREAGDAYRSAMTVDADRRLNAELGAAKENLAKGPRHRPARIRALETLGMIGGPGELQEVKWWAQSTDRRLSGIARRVSRMIGGSDLVERMKAFTMHPQTEPKQRGLVLRVLSEHFPKELEAQTELLRVHPDARVQRAIVPVVAHGPQGNAELAAMLAANPPEEHRPGLVELRLELIERLARRADPVTLPVLLEQYRGAGRDPSEKLALSRALVGFSDPRARQALAEAVRALERPPLP